MFKEAIIRPFSSPRRLIWSIVLFVIPIVNFIFFGYLYECVRTAQKKDLPEFKHYGTLFMNGFKMFIISLLYTLPVFILLTIATTFYLAIDDLLGFPLYALCILVAYLLPLALVNFAEHGSVAFAFQDLLKKAFTRLYLKTILQLLILLVPYMLINTAFAFVLLTVMPDALSWLSSFLTFLSTSILSVLYQITFFTILAQNYRKL